MSSSDHPTTQSNPLTFPSRHYRTTRRTIQPRESGKSHNSKSRSKPNGSPWRKSEGTTALCSGARPAHGRTLLVIHPHPISRGLSSGALSISPPSFGLVPSFIICSAAYPTPATTFSSAPLSNNNTRALSWCKGTRGLAGAARIFPSSLRSPHLGISVLV